MKKKNSMFYFKYKNNSGIICKKIDLKIYKIIGTMVIGEV